jgi:hypothetical protein
VARFALDENFPDTILDALKVGVREAELVPIRKIDPRLRQMDDWKLLLSLYHLGEWDGMVSADANILKLPRELAVIHQTQITLVVVEKAGFDPIRAAGLLLVHLPTICRKTVRTVGQLWRLSAQTKNHEEPWSELKKIAEHQHTSVNHLFQTTKLSAQELRQSPLTDLS